VALVLHVLHNPIYAGGYTYGRTQERRGLVNGEIHNRVRRRLSQADWTVCIKDRHPAYVSWEEFMGNLEKLQDNTTKASRPTHGAAQRGSALLQGLALCGRCGRRMSAVYPEGGKHGHYICRSPALVGSPCFGVTATEIDAAVAKLFLQAVQPTEIDLSLAVTREAERQAGEIEKQWNLRLEQARYAARLAERRYMAVDPDNRVVARTLERDWEGKLREIEELERDQAQAQQRDRTVLSADDRKTLLALAKDLPAVWASPTTTEAERKNLLRMAISDVALYPVDVPERQTRIEVLWCTGATTAIVVPRHQPGTVRKTPRKAIEIITQRFHQDVRDQAIADELNAMGLQTGTLQAWTVHAIRGVRHADGLTKAYKSRRPPDRRDDGLLSIHGVADHFGVCAGVVRYWRKRGWLVPVEGRGTGHDQWYRIDAQVEKELRERQRAGATISSTQHNGQEAS